MSDHPSVSQELHRKSVDALHRSIEGHDRGEISKRELGLVARALYDAVSGLVPTEASQLCADVADDCEK